MKRRTAYIHLGFINFRCHKFNHSLLSAGLLNVLYVVTQIFFILKYAEVNEWTKLIMVVPRNAQINFPALLKTTCVTHWLGGFNSVNQLISKCSCLHCLEV